MRSRVSASGFVVVASIAAVGMIGGPALAVDVPPADAVTAESDSITETDGQDSDEEGSTTDTLLDEIDGAVESTADAVQEGTNDAPEPIASTTDDGVEAVTDTTSQTTDSVRQTLGDADPPSDPSGGGGETPHRAAGDQPGAAPDPSAAPSAAGSPVAGGGAPARVPNRIALDGFRRTSDATRAVEVVEDPIFEPEPAFAPPTTRQVVEPVASGPALPLRAVAIEILVAAALLVFATGGLVAELGPERA